jgi:hypothetical protein
VIYAIRAIGTDFIKIGYTQSALGGVKTRLETMQTGCPHELELLAQCPGDRDLERHIHLMLDRAGLRHRGEWFKDCSKMRDVVRWIRDDVFSPKDKATNVVAINPSGHKRLGRALDHCQQIANG